MDLFDKLGGILSDTIGSHDNNHVGWAGENIIGYAEGGEVGDPLSAGNLLQSIGNAAKPAIDNGYGNATLGKFYNSPVYIASHYSQLGKFFNYPGNSYNTTVKQPQPNAPAEAEDPKDFYSRWYESMRRFAQAEEVATRGQPQVRST